MLISYGIELKKKREEEILTLGFPVKKKIIMNETTDLSVYQHQRQNIMKTVIIIIMFKLGEISLKESLVGSGKFNLKATGDTQSQSYADDTMADRDNDG